MALRSIRDNSDGRQTAGDGYPISGRRGRRIRRGRTIRSRKSFLNFGAKSSAARRRGTPARRPGKIRLRDVGQMVHALFVRCARTKSGSERIRRFERYVGERQARIRKITAADLKEKRGEIVAIHDVERVLADLVLATRAQILAIPPRLAPDLLGETSRVMIQLSSKKHARKRLNILRRRLARTNSFSTKTAIDKPTISGQYLVWFTRTTRIRSAAHLQWPESSFSSKLRL